MGDSDGVWPCHYPLLALKIWVGFDGVSVGGNIPELGILRAILAESVLGAFEIMRSEPAFEHLLLTCFNVDFGLCDRSQLLDETYLSQRFEIFEAFCVPSVQSQTCQNFRWLVLFDSALPKAFRDRVDALAQRSPLTPLYVPPVEDVRQFWQALVKRNITLAAQFVITTNLDNDDALHREFIATVQQQFQGQDFEFINFPFGYMLRANGLFLREFLASPFHSLIERAEEPLSCKTIAHNDLFDLAEAGVPVRQVVTTPLWLQGIHGSNVINCFDINSMVRPLTELRSGFALDPFLLVQREQVANWGHRWWQFSTQMLLNNPHRQPLGLRLRRVVGAIAPITSRLYLRLTQGLRSRRATAPLSPTEVRRRCQVAAPEYRNLGVGPLARRSSWR